MSFLTRLRDFFFPAKPRAEQSPDAPEFTTGMWLGIFLVTGVIVGLIALFLYVWHLPSPTYGFQVFARGLAISGASFVMGGLLGFLFGIPRRVQVEAIVASTVTAQTNPASDRARRLYEANTNLEQISDWLTKILVGVGLTQLNKAPGLLDQLGDDIVRDSPGMEKSFVLSLIIGYAVFGFLVGYLNTRFFMQAALEESEQQKGKREGLLKALALGLKLKFGPEGLQLIPAIQAITEVDKLETICDAIETATSLEELRLRFRLG